MLSGATATHIWSVIMISIVAGVATGQYTQLYIPNTTTGNYFAFGFRSNLPVTGCTYMSLFCEKRFSYKCNFSTIAVFATVSLPRRLSANASFKILIFDLECDSPLRTMGAGRRVQGGALAPPWNLKMMTSYGVCKENSPKMFARASGSRSNCTQFSIKPRKFTKNPLLFQRPRHGRIGLSTDIS